LDKAASTYGEELVNKFADKDGYIHADFNVAEAQTGRMSSTSPNLQNIPNTPEYRSCFIASEGCEIADMDYSAQEPRITASETEDKTLLDIIKSGKDIHTEVGKVVFKNPNMKKDDPKRKIAKTLNLGLSYGLTAAGLRNRVNQEKSDTDPEMSYDEAEAIVSDYFRQFYGVRQWIEAQRSSGQKLGYVETKSGRRMYINRYSYQWLNNAINSPIQGGAADCTKTALILFRKACKENKITYPVVNVVHDEIVIDCPSVNMDTAYLHLEQSMVTAGEKIYKNVPFAVEKFRGKHWGIKH
jgi:DNA polymerase I